MSDRPASPPYGSYAVLVGTFVGGLGLVGAAAARLDRPDRELRAIDLAALGLATFKAARTLSDDKVTSFVRQPFVEGHAYDGEDEEPAGEGMTRAIGELVTCTRCVGTWAGASLASLTIVAPRTGRLLTGVLAAGAISDWLLAGFAALTSKANELERETA